MGNSLGGRRSTKVMKVNGETMKFKKPMHAGEIVKNHPGHVLLDSEAVKHFGTRAKPLEAEQKLKPKRIYFLVELPKLPDERVPRKVHSGIHMSAKDRLESLMLSRRSASDLSYMKSSTHSIVLDESNEIVSGENGLTRIKMRLPRAELEKMMMQSRNQTEAVEKIMDHCMGNNKESSGNLHKQSHWKNDQGVDKVGIKSREKRVGFLPISEGEIQQAMTS
ncbi:hypothetical protein Leryth_023359 [Lithospermum erythrorhizon]|nr:hypothetical protein Leryth_023359 [Lithospermum erythrorhizon]